MPLLDEILTALDKKLREQMQVERHHLRKSVGITVVRAGIVGEDETTISVETTGFGGVRTVKPAIDSARIRLAYDRDAMAVAD